MNESPEKAQTLLEIIDRQNLKARWEIAKQEVTEGKLISEEELFQDLVWWAAEEISTKLCGDG